MKVYVISSGEYDYDTCEIMEAIFSSPKLAEKAIKKAVKELKNSYKLVEKKESINEEYFMCNKKITYKYRDKKEEIGWDIIYHIYEVEVNKFFKKK